MKTRTKALKRITVEIKHETRKAYLIKDDAGRQGWIQKRWMKDDHTVAVKTFEKAVESFVASKKFDSEYREYRNSFHALGQPKRETEKAVAFEVVLDYYDVEKTRTTLVWFPKSQGKNGTGEWSMKGWLIDAKIEELGSGDEYGRNLGGIAVESIGDRKIEQVF